ncbi:HAD family hydrolase [Acetivibrio sp. MSJd-27]|jgi:HAD hydrolase, family IIB|uniref:HAD family hydrolase n=1 Tax=Acetivibrio sp. MSJd-27 TaxID=2841523 RepID=UPI0015A980F0|nr:HAD family hydrolase [Acetivibrio sp. MSJd-27]MBU5449282.1 HAD family hydrolase [Acetivibrio sp. MSJd-27]
MKKAVFFDWDGTLSFDGNHMSPENRKAIRKLQKKGHLAFLCTGRSYAFIPEEALEFGFDGIVCGAGSHVIIGDKTIFRVSVPEDMVREIFHHFRSDGQTCVLEGEDAMFVINEGKSSHTQWPVLKDPEDFDRFAAGHPITKLTLYGTPGEASKILLDNYFSLIVHPYYQEAVIKGCNKATGIEKVLNDCHLTQRDSVSFGDSPNDLDMLRYTALSIVMGNAPEEVKKTADKITGTAEEHGVAEALKKWILT